MQLTLDHVCRSYGGRSVLRQVTLARTGLHAFVLIGPSGGGKSTVLRLIAGLECPDSGSISVNGRRLSREESDLLRYRRTIGMLFQSYNLFPHLTARDNIMLPLERVHGKSRAEAMEVTMALLRRFRLEPHALKRPAELSGGQRQRIALSRAMAIQPQVLLLDEPTSALDPEMTAEVLDMIVELRDAGTDLILVTHEMGFAREVGDWVGLLVEGHLIEAARPCELFEHPRSAPGKRFLARVLKY